MACKNINSLGLDIEALSKLKYDYDDSKIISIVSMYNDEGFSSDNFECKYLNVNETYYYKGRVLNISSLT